MSGSDDFEFDAEPLDLELDRDDHTWNTESAGEREFESAPGESELDVEVRLEPAQTQTETREPPAGGYQNLPQYEQKYEEAPVAKLFSPRLYWGLIGFGCLCFTIAASAYFFRTLLPAFNALAVCGIASLYVARRYRKKRDSYFG